MITQEELKTVLHYDPVSGVFTRVKNNKTAGTPKGDRKYLITRVLGCNHFLHKLAWVYVHGGWPMDQIDHINGDRQDNRIENLRLATNADNNRNKKVRKSKNGLFVKGVAKAPDCNRYRAFITFNYKRIELGYFLTKDEAAHAYNKKAIELFGDFACLNPIGVDKEATPSTHDATKGASDEN